MKSSEKWLTLFAIPRAFQGHFGVIQRNAINSWAQLRPRIDVLLCGSDKGTAKVAAEFGFRNLPNVEMDASQRFMYRSVFRLAYENARTPFCAYVNADIILFQGFLDSLSRILKTQGDFLATGRRWDLDLPESLDFSQPDWEARLQERIRREAPPQHQGLDYFVFPRDSLGKLAQAFIPLYVGQRALEGWMLYWARTNGWKVLDATSSITIVHSNHQLSAAWAAPELRKSYELMGGIRHNFCVFDATHLLAPKGVRPAWRLLYLERRVETLPIFYPFSHFVIDPLYAAYSLFKRGIRLIGRLLPWLFR